MMKGKVQKGKINANRIMIKNMVCPRCIMAVENLLKEMNIAYQKVMLGVVDLDTALTEEELTIFIQKLNALGFEIIDDRRGQIIEQIKQNILNLLANDFVPFDLKLSDYLSEHIYLDYSYLSKLFSEVEGLTIEQYFILQKIEKVKELLVYDEMTIKEIADQLAYSSPAHLSTQFKKITGLSPSYFKKVGLEKRKSIDNL